MLLLFFFLTGISHIQAEGSGSAQIAIPVHKENIETTVHTSCFDFSAMDKIWGIISILERDEEPSEDAWTALIRTPGYAALISHEHHYGLDFLKRNLRLIFKPSRAEELKKVAHDGSVGHFIGLKEKRAALKDFQVRLQNPSVQAKAMELLEPWFPSGSLDDKGKVPASFIVFDKDARGGYGLLIFDILYALDQGEEFIPLFAHEAFHYYRDKSLAYDDGNVLMPHQYILMSIDMIQNEGIADQIDKPGSLFKGGSRFESSYARRYRDNMAETPHILGALDDELCQLMGSNPDYHEIGRNMISAIPMSGHPTGYFMTQAILKTLGTRELTRTFNNPFAFFYLYNTAATKDKSLPRLSNAAILGLHKLEKKYVSLPEKKLAATAMDSGIDLSALEDFRRIVALLEKDKTPQSMLWDKFFRNPGYRALFVNETSYSREKILDLITLVFKPSREADLNRALEEGGSYSLNHFIRHKKEMKAVLKAIEQVKDGQIFKKTFDRVKTLWPQQLKQDIFHPSLSFVYFANDLRYGYPVMVVDPMWLVNSPKSFSYYLKLYLLWTSANRVRPFNEENLSQRQYVFLDGLDRIQRFGLCDLLAFEDGSLEKMKVFARYETNLSEVAHFIEEMDEVLAHASGSPDIWKQFPVTVNKFITRPGCPLGYVMARTILDILGREALAESTGDPIAFTRLYQKSALKKGGLPVFSSESMKYISLLESKCYYLNRE